MDVVDQYRGEAARAARERIDSLAMVFPLGMYATGTFQLSRALDLPFLTAIPKGMVVVAILAWLATFIGFLTHLSRISWAGVRSAAKGG